MMESNPIEVVPFVKKKRKVINTKSEKWTIAEQYSRSDFPIIIT